MEEFKLKSIDEFDEEFAQLIGTSARKQEPVAPAEPVKKPITSAINFPGNEAFLQNESPAEEKPQEERKPFSLFAGIDDEDDEDEDDEPKAKSSKGALAGKIVSIVMLAVTVVVFVLGCFVSVFLDNNGAAIAKTTLNTMAQDNEKLQITKGALVPGKLLEPQEYQVGDAVAVASQTGEGCDVLQITNVQFYGEDATLTLNDVNIYSTRTVNSSECYGKVESFIPSLAGFINFAMDNAILVCVLFVLLAALWCLVLVLIEKSTAKKQVEETAEAEEDGYFNSEE